MGIRTTPSSARSSFPSKLRALPRGALGPLRIGGAGLFHVQTLDLVGIDDQSGTMTKYLHTMIRITDPEATVRFFELIGLTEVRRIDSEQGRFTLIFLAAPGQEGIAEVELTHNWDPEDYSGGRNFGHLAYRVDDIYATCQRLMEAGVTINRPPRDGRMAFVRSPDGISVELLQDGALPPSEPWASMANVGAW